jgi:hypothetical protein
MAKPVEFLRQIAPNARRPPRIANPTQSEPIDGRKLVFPEVDTDISKLGFESQRHLASRDEDLETIFAAILASRAQAIYVYSNPFRRGPASSRT